MNKAVPFFFGAIALEYILAFLTRLPPARLNDAFSSIAAGTLSQLSKIIILSAELALYVFIYDNFNLITLPWDYPGTWYFCFIGVDFIYYWFHRAAHGKKIIIYKLPTSLRNGVSLDLLVSESYLRSTGNDARQSRSSDKTAVWDTCLLTFRLTTILVSFCTPLADSVEGLEFDLTFFIASISLAVTGKFSTSRYPPLFDRVSNHDG
ncbi:hypothetical protein pdam_00017468 [Pocillopora damicornis]|uniref:Uncharacterized protein n=1 Tax=Pocillopora damicornis TaxID=46731 RepID=A0A3M6UQV2_POCDA|nr:hypothetical protein pdam_00017468 [Pocillopora damicornis]